MTTNIYIYIPGHQDTLPRSRCACGVNIYIYQDTKTNHFTPLALRVRGKKGHTRRPVYLKTYACIFICFVTKASHIELVSDLISKSFLAALKRFVSRRGCPTHLQSDNGSNFVGASNMLKEIYAFLAKEETQGHISSFAATQRITWLFSPERAHHFGGLWEAAVKSLKFHLKRVVGDQHLTFEELTTVLCQIECCLNSRPLAPRME